MAQIQWIIGTAGSAERLVGANNTSYADVLNRPLQQVLALSGVASSADFQGFALAGVSGSISSSYALTASYALNGGSGGGTSISASYADFALQAQFAPLYFQTAGGTITGPISLGNNLDIIVPSDQSAAGTLGIGGDFGIALYSDSSQTIILQATSNLVEISGSLNIGNGADINVLGGQVTASGFLSLAPSTFTGSVQISGSLFSRTTIKSVTGSYSMSLFDQYVVVSSAGTTASISLPLAANTKGLTYTIRKNDAGPAPLLIDAAGLDTIDGLPIASSSLLFDTLVLTSDGATSWMSRGRTSGSSGGGSTAVSSSYALSASYAMNAGGTSVSSSFATNALTANAATSASYATLAQNVLGSITSASYALTASYATTAQNVLGSITSASFATTASYAQNIARLTTVLVTGSFSASAQDAFIICSAQFNSASVYLPSAAGIPGQSIAVRKDDPSSFPVIIRPNGTDSIDGASGRQLIVGTDSAVFISDGGSMWKSDGAASSLTPDLLYDAGPNAGTLTLTWLITRDTQKITLTANASTTIQGIPAGGYLIVDVFQDSPGLHTHSFLQAGMGSLVWDQGATPTQTGTPLKMDRYTFYNAGTRVIGWRVLTSV